MKHFLMRALALSAALVLSACGGGGGGGQSPMDSMPPTGDPTGPTESQAQQQFAEIGQKADRIDMTETRVWYNAPPAQSTTAYSECYETVECDIATDEFSLIVTPANLGAIPRNADIQNRGSRQGVPLVEYAGTSSNLLDFRSLSPPNSVDYRTLGGWMEYSFFAVNLWEFDPTTWQLWNAASAGLESGSNPVSGSATWTGAMVGRTRGEANHEEPGVAVVGNSNLTFDFSANQIDVALTGIQADDGTTYADLTWENIPTVLGRFVSQSGSVADGSVRGNFYGPNHEEVGGVFEHEQMLGAFGGTRQ